MENKRGGDYSLRSKFSETEMEYLAENFIGRLATVSRDSVPHVVPVSYQFDGENIYFSGYSLTKTLKYRHILTNSNVAFVVDDVVSTRPWKARGVEVRGRAEIIESGNGKVVKIVPLSVRSWGLGQA